MSVANHKKTEDEIVRNSLVVESIQMVKKITPKVFIFENVAAFMKTGCTAPDGNIKEIGQVIKEELEPFYSIYYRIINFKNYGSNSSRTRTLVIGVERSYADFVSPIELFPDYQEEKSLRNMIGDFPVLDWGEFSANDFYHQFRTYPEHMRDWIHNVAPGKSAFDNSSPHLLPHRVIDGKIVVNQNKNGDKYTRQEWDKVAPCIHTRNDQIASQNTIHPEQDRVFSIRELMRLMTIPDHFQWIDASLEELNMLSLEEKRKLLKKEEINIRQSIGEAVPTNIFYKIAVNIQSFFVKKNLTTNLINELIEKEKLVNASKLFSFIQKNEDLGTATLAKIAELANTKREHNDAYFTNKSIITEIIKGLPDFSGDEIHILEPSVGVGNIIPFLIRKYDAVSKIKIDIVDIDSHILKITKLLLEKQQIPAKVEIRYIHDNFLTHTFHSTYDVIIGNPPFTKLKATDANLSKYLTTFQNKDSHNLVAFFFEKAMALGKYVALIAPKSILNTSEYQVTRQLLEKMHLICILDHGESGFKGVLVETVCIIFNTNEKPRYHQNQVFFYW